MCVKGRFVAFEGIDGCGKTYQADRIAEYLKSKGCRVHRTAEPTSGPIGTLIKNIQKGGAVYQPTEMTMMCLYAADRAEHNKEIRSYLDNGEWVVCDRYILSSMAYQGFESTHVSPYMLNSCFIEPDMSIILDVPVETAVKRIAEREGRPEMYEDRDFLEKVREAYDRNRLWNSLYSSIYRIDGTQDRDAVTAAIVKLIEESTR